ncbi:MAG TPA: carboxypeptidase-like regulatory domain-containing protein, partial [Myxococcales bacterium]|nr:carboxypeptidase-like regulatory domain-containing protein [Myxococcales bacterium]
MKRYLLLGGALVLVVIGARMVKGMQESSPGTPAPPPASRPLAGGNAARVNADLSPIPIVADPLAAGTYRLQGLVLGAGDLPVEGAAVTLEASAPRTARTDRGGAFAFDGLPPGLYRLEARQGGQVAGPVTAALREGTGPVTLRLRPAAVVEVEVVDARTRQGLPGATVELRGESALSASGGAGGKARFEGVRSGRYALKAAAPGHAPALKPLVVGDSSELERVTMELGTGAAASGEVRDDRGRPVAGIPVVAELASTLVSISDAH